MENQLTLTEHFWGFFGRTPKRGNFQKVCYSGFHLYDREATAEEVEAYKDRQRELGFSYPNLTAMVREVSVVDGPEGRKEFMRTVRKYLHHIEQILRVGDKKRDKHEARKAANRQKLFEHKQKKQAEKRKDDFKKQPSLFDAPLIEKEIGEVPPLKSSKKKKKRTSQLSLF